MELTLAALGTAALTEGIKFLYAQATDILQRRRERKAEKPVDDTVAPVSPSVVDGTLPPTKVDWEVVDRLEPDVVELLASLSPYREGLREVDPSDEGLLRRTDALRRALEVVIGRRITFKGEDRDPSGTVVTGEAEVDDVAGFVAGVRVRTINAGEVRGKARGKRIEVGGEIIGVEAGDVQ